MKVTAQSQPRAPSAGTTPSVLQLCPRDEHAGVISSLRVPPRRGLLLDAAHGVEAQQSRALPTPQALLQTSPTSSLGGFWQPRSVHGSCCWQRSLPGDHPAMEEPSPSWERWVRSHLLVLPHRRAPSRWLAPGSRCCRGRSARDFSTREQPATPRAPNACGTQGKAGGKPRPKRTKATPPEAGGEAGGEGLSPAAGTPGTSAGAVRAPGGTGHRWGGTGRAGPRL